MRQYRKRLDSHTLLAVRLHKVGMTKAVIAGVNPDAAFHAWMLGITTKVLKDLQASS